MEETINPVSEQQAVAPAPEPVAAVASPMDQNPADQVNRDVGDIFSGGVPDMSHIFQPHGPTGTGTPETDRYMSTLLTLPQVLDPNTPVLDNIRYNQDQIAKTPQDELMGNLQHLASGILQGTLNNYVKEMQNMYAVVPNKQIVSDAKANVAQMTNTINTGGTTDQLATNLYYATKSAKDADAAERMKSIGKTMIFNRFMDENFPKGIWSSAKSWASDFIFPTGVRNLVHGYMPWDQVEQAKAFRAKMPAEQLKALPGILKYLKSISDNKYIFETNAEPFINSEDVNTVYKTLALDTVATASMLPLSKMARLGRVVGTPAFIARESGAIDTGGKIAAEAMMDATGAAAKTAGTSRELAAGMSLPFGGEAHMPEMLNGVNVAAQRAIEAVLSPVHKILNRIVSGADVEYHLLGSLEKADRDAFQDNLLKTHAGHVEVIKSDEFGLTYAVTLEKEAGPGLNVTQAMADFASEQEVNAGLKTQLAEQKAAGTPPPFAGVGTATPPAPLTLPGMGKAIAANLKDGMWGAFSKGKVTFAGVRDPLLKAAKAAGVSKTDRAAFDAFVDKYSGQGATAAPRQIPFNMNRLEQQLRDSNLRLSMKKAAVEAASKATSPNMVKETQVKYVRYTRNNIGGFDALEFHAAPFISSADTVMNQIHNLGSDYVDKLVTRATLIGRQQEHVLGLWRSAIQPLFEKASKKELSDLSAVVEQGNINKVDRYSNADLLTGVQTKKGVIRFTTGEQLARYHASRDIMHAHFLTNNQILKRELLFSGFDRSIEVNTLKGKTMNFIRGSSLERLPGNMTEIYDTRAGKVVQITDKQEIQGLLDSGQMELYEAKLPIQYETDRKVTHILADKKSIRTALPDHVLEKVPGYYGPLMYKNIFHIVVKHATEHVDGVEKSVQRVDRAFSSRQEAIEYLKQPGNGGKEIVPSKEFTDPTSQRLDASVKEDYQSKVFGGFTTSQREDERLAFGLNGTPAETRSALEAMEAAISNVSERMPMNDFKLGLIQRFLNSAKRPMAEGALERGEKPLSYLSDGADWTSPITQVGPEGKALRFTQEWMKSLFHVQTKEQRAFQRTMYDVGSFLDGKTISVWTGGLSRHLSNWAMNMGSNDVYSAARTLSFHALLGWFNPRQLWVQAAGAVAAMSVNPEKAAFLIPRYMALRAVAFDDLKATTGLVHGAISRATSFMERQQWEDLVKAYHRSGIRDSIRTSADYDAAVKGFGMTRQALNRAADHGLFFLRESEMFNRSYNWLWAHSKFMEGKASGYRLTLADERGITADSLRIGTNLMKENRAAFQKGFWSIPLQFQQVSSKFLGNMLHGMKSGKSNWSGFERVKIGLGQVALFGAAGVPFGKWAAGEMTNWLKDDGDYGLGIKDPDKIAAVNGGFVDWMLDRATGTTGTVAGSMSYAGNFGEMLQNFTHIDGNFAHAIGGAFSSVGDRAVEAAGSVARILARDVKVGDIDEQDLKEIATTVGGILTSIRSINKAVIWEQSKLLRNSKGEILRSIDPSKDLPTLLLQALGGIPPRELQDMHDLQQSLKDQDKKIQGHADAIIQLAMGHFNNPYYNTEKGMAKSEAGVAIINLGLKEAEKAQVMDLVMAKLRENDDQVSRTILKTVKMQQDREGNAPELEFNSILAPRQDQSDK